MERKVSRWKEKELVLITSKEEITPISGTHKIGISQVEMLLAAISPEMLLLLKEGTQTACYQVF